MKQNLPAGTIIGGIIGAVVVVVLVIFLVSRNSAPPPRPEERTQIQQLMSDPRAQGKNPGGP